MPPRKLLSSEAPTSGGVGLAAFRGIEDRFARILLRPDGGITRRRLLPTHDDSLISLDERMRRALRAWFVADLAISPQKVEMPEINFLFDFDQRCR
jgi:hypothetical protein